MKKRITRFGVYQTAKVFGVMYFFLTAIFAIPFGLISMISGFGSELGFSGGLLLLLPFVYALFGFLFVALGCAIYNLIAKWTGGIEVEVGTETVDAPDLLDTMA